MLVIEFQQSDRIAYAEAEIRWWKVRNNSVMNPYQDVDRFREYLSNINFVDKQSIRPIVESCINPSLRERILTLNYDRAAINAELLVSMLDTRQFQAISMLARNIFEISVEVKLINLHKDAASKIELFNRIEKLRVAKKLVAYKDKYPSEAIHAETYRKFISKNESQILTEQAAMWPGTKKVKHWTLKDLSGRADELGGIFRRIYEVSYAEFSWQVHGGTTGVLNVSSSAFAFLAGISYKIAADSYGEILEVLIREFHITTIDEIVRQRIQHAQLYPFAETPEEKEAILAALGVRQP